MHERAVECSPGAPDGLCDQVATGTTLAGADRAREHEGVHVVPVLPLGVRVVEQRLEVLQVTLQEEVERAGQRCAIMQGERKGGTRRGNAKTVSRWEITHRTHLDSRGGYFQINYFLPPSLMRYSPVPVGPLLRGAVPPV